jgi:hypothetical protein
MANRAVVKTIVFWMILIFTFVLGSCAQSSDPIDRMNAYYDEVIRMLTAPTQDIKEKKTKIEQYWNSKKPEIERLNQILSTQISRLSGSAEREVFAKHFDLLIEKLVTIRKLFKEQGIEI